MCRMVKIKKNAGGVSLKSYYKLVRHDGNQDLFRAVEMSVVALSNGYPLHIHAQGLRGTGKTSIMRAVKDILPPIVRIKNCIYNCHPAAPHCPEHRNLLPEDIALIGTETVPCPFLEISHSAKIGTVVGSIDLAKLTDKTTAVAALLPGTIPKAHRGIIFVDEINRLADTSPEIADVLLDLMGTKPGRIQVEEIGLPTVELPVSVSVWAASNPDEDPGPLVQIRKQLADRFDLAVNMGRASDYQAVMAILNNNGNQEAYKPITISGNLEKITSDDKIKNIFASIYVDYGLESLRAVESMEKAASISALISGRTSIGIEDITNTIPLVLNGRADSGTIASILKYLESTRLSNPEVNLEPTVCKEQQAEGLKSESRHETDGWWKKLQTNLKNIFNINRYAAKPLINPPIADKSSKSNHFSQSETKKSNTANCKTDNERGNADYSVSANSPMKQSLATKTEKSGTIEDPAKMVIQAPPNKAVPLSKLSIEKFVSSEEN